VKACIPVAKDHGLSSVVFPHFGSAPVFLVVNTDTGDVSAHANPAANTSGRSHALDAIGEDKVDVAVVGNIGAGAIDRFRAQGIPVYRAVRSTVAQVVSALQAGMLPEIDAGTCAGGHAEHRSGLPVQGTNGTCGCGPEGKA